MVITIASIVARDAHAKPTRRMWKAHQSRLPTVILQAVSRVCQSTTQLPSKGLPATPLANRSADRP